MALTQVTSAGVKDGELVNADLHSAAAIALSKLGTSGTAGSGNFLRGDGAWTAIDLTALNASNLTSGTVAAARLDTATTQSASNNSTKIATTAYVETAVSNLVNSAPSSLDTLKELSDALGADANFSTTVTNSIATKLPLAGGTLTGNVKLNDSIKTIFGSDDDAYMMHNGSHQYNRCSTGYYHIQAQEIRFNKADGQETLLKAISNGAVELYYDNSKTFETISGGATVTGQLYVTAELNLINGSSNAAKYIDCGLGDNNALTIRGTSGGDANHETLAKFIRNGACEFYHDTAKKFETTSAGVEVTGRINLSDNLDMPDSAKVILGTGDDLQIWHNGSTGNSNIKQVTGDLYFYTGSDLSIHMKANGAVDLYYDNSKKFNTHADGIEVLGKLYMGDSKNIELGNSQDLKIFHDGSNSQIREEGTGNLMLISDNQIRFEKASPGEAIASFNVDGACELYYDASKKFNTYSGGIEVTGLKVLDNNKLKIGNSEDLQLWHDGTDSIIRNLTGETRIQCANIFEVTNYGNTETYIKGSLNGSVELYYNNSRKLHTRSDGVNVIGDLDMTDADGYKINLGVSSDLQLYHDGSNSHIVDNGTGSLLIKGDAVHLGTTAGGYYLRSFLNGAVELRYNNSKRFETSGNGAIVYGPEGTDATLYIYADEGDDNHDRWKLTASAADSNFYLSNYASGSWESSIVCHDSGGVELYYDNVKKFQTESSGVSVTAGHLYLGDSYKAQFGASQDLQIYHNGSSSVIKDAGTGGLQIITNDLSIANAANSESLIQAYQDGAVNLFYNGSKKFETTSSGVSITGDLSVSGSVGGAGKILQVITTTITGQQSGTNNSDSTENTTDLTGFSLNITPSSTSSKILLMASVSHSSTNWSFCIHAYRDSTIIAQGDALGGNRTQYTWLCAAARDHNDANTATTFHIIDSPSSTSQITYKLKGCSRGTNSTWNINKAARHGQYNTGWIQSCVSTFTLMEIG